MAALLFHSSAHSLPPRMSPVAHRPIIWLLDDSKTETEVIRSTLAPTCRVSTFTDGTTLVEALTHQPLPDLMVLDWEMPGLSGLEVCEYLRTHPPTATLPVLLLTVHQGTEDVVRGLEAGANDYVFKPFRPAELAARVHALARWDQLRKQALSDERALELGQGGDEVEDQLAAAGCIDSLGHGLRW